jgi:hypothetical protein
MKILVTAAGTGTAFSYASAIAKSFPEVTLYTADTNPGELVTSALYAEKHFQTKSIYEGEFYTELAKVIEQNKINYYIPLIDEEIVKSSNHPLLKDKVAANSVLFCNSCIEKDRYSKSFEVEGISFPRLIERTEVVGFKNYIAKSNGGFGGRGTKKINGSEIDTLGNEFVVYEHVSGNEYTVDCFPLNDSVITSIRMRIEVKNGVCTKAKIIRNEVLENVAELICQKYKLSHPFCFQVIEQGDKFYLIDFNPRLGAGSAMSAINGLDFFSAHIAKILGEDIKKYLNRHHESCIVTRQYANYLNRVF